MNETIRFKNRFRILYKGKVLSLNSMTNKLGYNQFVAGFETLQEAIDTRRAYASLRGVHEEDMEIASYSGNQRYLVPGFSNEANREFERRKTFSGKGLRFKNWETPKDNKYTPDKYYGPEIAFAQSAERGKGLSTIAKIKEKKKRFNATEVWGRVSTLANDGAMTLGYSLVESMKKKPMGKKAMRRYLRSKGYTIGQTLDIIDKVFDKSNP